MLYFAEQPGSARVAVFGAVYVFQWRTLCSTGDSVDRLGSLEVQLAQEHTACEESGGPNRFPKPRKSLRAVGNIAAEVVRLSGRMEARRRSVGRRIVAHLGALELQCIPPLLENTAVGTHCQLPT